MKRIVKFFYDPNMVAIIPITLVYSYGLYVFVAELVGRFI
jgi:hypothetical protein|tara:strand:+ start:396 stop:515 length:120 start_codon:yes stop_codon:yes gene_type:complete